jgi:cell division septal protein FtsQ
VKQKILNKRKKNFLNINIRFLIFLIFIIFLFFYLYLINHKVISNLNKTIQLYSDKYNYNIENIKISNLEYVNEYDLLKYFEKYKNKSIFLVPIKKIAKQILQNKWINQINIKIDYKNSVKIELKEEVPLGIYYNNKQKILFSKNLIILELIEDNKYLNELIIFMGENSIINSMKLISLLDKDFLINIRSANYISNRRWNLILKNSILIKLPENDIKKALKNYKKIYANFSNKDLKGIDVIDLRIPNQAIIKYKN